MPTPTAQKPTGLVTKRTFMIILAIVAALIGAVLFLVGGSDDTGALLQSTSARHSTLQRLVADGQKNITSDDLAKVNSELSIILAGQTNALQAEVRNAGIKKLEASIISAEADADTFETLKTAKVNGQYDSTYQNVLTKKLESMLALIDELHTQTKSKSLKATLTAAYEQLSAYSKTLEALPN